MSTESRPLPTRSQPTVSATTAVLFWTHRRGGDAHCLLRVVTARPAGADSADAAPGLSVTVVASELRDNARGHEIDADFAGLAAAVGAQLLPPATDPASLTWYAHHGQFSTYDVTGPETMTRMGLRPTSTGYADDLRDHVLLSGSEFRDLVAVLGLAPVEQVLASRRWAGLDERHRPITRG